jgi:hypothetical protein
MLSILTELCDCYKGASECVLLKRCDLVYRAQLPCGGVMSIATADCKSGTLSLLH